jgi:hypothetical protein
MEIVPCRDNTLTFFSTSFVVRLGATPATKTNASVNATLSKLNFISFPLFVNRFPVGKDIRLINV